MTDEEIDYNVQKELDKLQNVKSHIEKLNWQEEASLSSIDASKEELVNMIRIPRQSGKIHLNCVLKKLTVFMTIELTLHVCVLMLFKLNAGKTLLQNVNLKLTNR